MKNILVPCDFSEQAINAFRFALDISRKAKGKVHLVHVIELPVVHDSVFMPVLSFEEVFIKELREKAEKEFTKLTTKYGSPSDKVSTHVLFGGTFRMLEDYIANESIDLVIMGTKGATGAREILVGSNTEKVVRRSPVPVIAVKKYMEADSIKNIVFPNTLDTEKQESLVMRVKALQDFFKATLHIVWINTPTNFTPDRITTQRLEAFAKRFMFKNYTVNVYNDPYEEAGIINFTHSIKADMIAMGTHGRKGLAHVLAGSIAEEVVNHVDCPIWTYSLKK
ncbi:MAG: universal stress protein [Cyclobacteriaceae bacterium]|nr:universal stress protein [Cyclobacteriaceae bacterium]MCX7637144.1 universal stress protein [Cyclobacteriaceae bacterium]MDW8330046.1 universal stress protein [Cyclobacteriaceae bacterium]